MNLQVNNRTLDELREMIQNIDREKFPTETAVIEARILEIENGIPKYDNQISKSIFGYETTPPYKFTGKRILFFPNAVSQNKALEIFLDEFKKSNAESAVLDGNTIFIPNGFRFSLNRTHPLKSIKRAKISIDAKDQYMFVKYEFEEFGKSKLSMLIRIVVLAVTPIIVFWMTNFSILAFLASIPILIIGVFITGLYFTAIVNRAIRRCHADCQLVTHIGR